MELLEKELEDIVFKSPNRLLQDRGLDIFGKKYRQVSLYNYGIADIITFRKHYSPQVDLHTLTIDIWELKKDQVNINTLMQACRYVKAIKRIIEEGIGDVGRLLARFECVEISINLLGTSIDYSSDFLYAIDFIENVSVYIAAYDLNGINFEQKEGFILNNEGF